MSIENTTVVNMPSVGQETAPEQTASNELETRHTGILDIDAAEPEVTDNPDASIVPEISQEGEDEITDPFEGFEDFEFEGKVFKVPSEIKDGYLRQADYTRKTQAVAEQTKQIQAREAELTQRFQQTEEEFKTWRELDTVSEQLKSVAGIDWNAEYQKILNDPNLRNDPLLQQEEVNKFQSIYMQVQQLQQKQQGLMNTARQFEQQRTVAAQQDTAKRLQETTQFAQKNIKGWTPDLDLKITEFAQRELGYTTEILQQGINPANYKTLHLAYLGHQSQLRQQTAKPSPTGSPATATKTLSAKASPSVSNDLETMSAEDYVKARMAGKIR